MPAVLNKDPATRDTFGHIIFSLSSTYENVMPPSRAEKKKKPLRITFPLLRLKWAFKRLVLLSYFQIPMNSSWWKPTKSFSKGVYIDRTRTE